MSGNEEVDVSPEISKQSYRKKVWDHLEKNDLAQFPRPVHGRIPNFRGSQPAAHKLSELEPFKNAVTIKICPDKPQELVRILALQARKIVLMPIPRLREGLFQRLHLLGSVSKEEIKYAASARGAKELGKPLSFDAKVKVDFVVLGSVAVSKEGYRIGKGEGFADLEYAILKEMGAIDDDVLVATSVHDCQVFEEIPRILFKEHDAPVDVIVTPTKVIHVPNKLPKPKGIIWDLLTPKQLKDMPILQRLRRKQMESGKSCSLKGESGSKEGEKELLFESVRSEGGSLSQNTSKFGRVQDGYAAGERNLPARQSGSEGGNLSQNRNKFGRVQSGYAASVTSERNLPSKQARSETESLSLSRNKFSREQHPPITIRVGNISSNVRVRDLKAALASCGIRPTHIVWRGSNGYALLQFTSVTSSPSSVTALLKDMKLGDSEVSVEETSELS